MEVLTGMSDGSMESLTNGFSNKENSMTNESMRGLARSSRQIMTERIADRLVDKYKAPGSRKFFLKAAWHLSEDFIWTTWEISRNKTFPIKYFVKSCKNEMMRQTLCR